MGDTINDTAKGPTWENREGPDFIRFKTGDKWEFVLIGRERLTVKGKGVIRYTGRLQNGRLVAFLGTADLITKLRTDDMGHGVRIHCMGDNVSVQPEGGNPMKVFEVQITREILAKPEQLSPLGDGTEITDDDIPF